MLFFKDISLQNNNNLNKGHLTQIFIRLKQYDFKNFQSCIILYIVYKYKYTISIISTKDMTNNLKFKKRI